LVFSGEKVKWEESSMVHTIMTRIYNARMAGIRAQNQWFKDYWHGVADELERKMRSTYN
jgi:hypothetical protein